MMIFSFLLAKLPNILILQVPYDSGSILDLLQLIPIVVSDDHPTLEDFAKSF